MLSLAVILFVFHSSAYALESKEQLYQAAEPYVKYFVDKGAAEEGPGFEGLTRSFRLYLEGSHSLADEAVINYGAATYDQVILGRILLENNDTTILDTYVSYYEQLSDSLNPLINCNNNYYDGSGSPLNYGPYRIARILGRQGQGEWWNSWDWIVDTGAAACLILYAAEAYEQTQNEDYKNLASLFGDYILELQDADGGIRYGPRGMYHDPEGLSDFYWNLKSTEQNERALYALEALYEITGNSTYDQAADYIKGWLKSMYHIDVSLFHSSAIFNGSEWIPPENFNSVATDVMAFAPLELMFEDTYFGATPEERDTEIDEMFSAIEERTAFFDIEDKLELFAFSISQEGDYGSVEMSSQMALAYLKVAQIYAERGNSIKKQEYLSKYNDLVDSLENYFSTPPDGPGTKVAPYASYLDYSVAGAVPTGTGYYTYNCGAALASAYFAFAKAGYDPCKIGGGPGIPGVTTEDKIESEANYILSCQYLDGGDAYGCINNVRGEPTWVVPRENAMAILGLIIASEVLDDDSYLDKAQLAADYLVRVQDTADGAWYDQYNYADVHTYSKSPTQTAEVMIALYKLGYDVNRYTSMKKGAEFLMQCQLVENKTGTDDGLICGGKDESGNYHTWRWASDNSYAYQALVAASGWAVSFGDYSFGNQCKEAAGDIINGINTWLYNAPVWHVAINENGVPQEDPGLPSDYDSWISYAPQMLDLPVTGADSLEVGNWIKNTFQQPDGSCIGYVSEESILQTRKYPGLSFQAALCWLDLGQGSYADEALFWAENSGLKNTSEGGWVDWVEISPNEGELAGGWLRFIDTSFYAIACLNGGYDFSTYYKLNLDMPWYANETPYNSTGAAVSQMILNYIRGGVASALDQDTIYDYGYQYNYPGNSSLLEMDARAVDRTLGHFDPYDALVSNELDDYDTRPGGNPYQGYNFTVHTYESGAINEYMRDICHWMAYTVTKENWRLDGELVTHPNTPAAIPIYGTYDNWVAIKGYAASANPCPEPHTNPYNTPDFTIYGFWITDPQVIGIGENTYKTAAECELTYFMPLATDDKHDGMFLQVAEPPAESSTASIKIAEPMYKRQKISVHSLGFKKQSLFDIVDLHLLSDPHALAAFSDTEIGDAILVKSFNKSNSDYYLIPFLKAGKSGESLASAVVILDANDGHFKEASWTKNPEKFLKVNKAKAIILLKRQIIKDLFSTVKTLLEKYPKKWHFLIVRIVCQIYTHIIHNVNEAEPELIWEPDGFSSSPYSPYWKINASGYSSYVTQEGKVVKR